MAASGNLVMILAAMHMAVAVRMLNLAVGHA